MTDSTVRSALVDRHAEEPARTGAATHEGGSSPSDEGPRTLIAKQLRFLLMVTGLIPIIIIGAWGIMTSRTEVGERAIVQQEEAVDHAAHLYEDFFQEAELVLQAAALSAGWNTLDEESLQVLLSTLLAQSSSFEELSFVGVDGVERARVSRTLPSALLPLRDLLDDPVFSPAASTATFFGIPEASEFGTLAPISVAELDPETGEPTGVLLGSLRLTHADGSREGLNGGTVTTYLLDGDGVVIAHSSPATAVRRPSFPDPERTGFRDGLQGDPAVVATHELVFGNVAYLVVAETPSSEALAPWTDELVRWATLLVVAFGFALVMPRLISRSLTTDLSVLGAAARALGNGELRTRVSVSRDDELGDLGTALNTMAAQLEKSLEEVEQSRREIADAYEDLERFTSATAHDLQEPIRKVQTYGSLLGRSADQLDDLGRSRLARLTNAITDLEELTTALFDYTQVLRYDEPPSRVDLGELVGWCRARRADDLEAAGGTVGHGDLPSVDAPPSAVALILDELLGNAIRFSREGSPLRVTISTEQRPGLVRIVFSDNGEGFDPRYEDLIFEPFERLHAKGIHPGTGMGLAVARRYARRIGGELTGHGSTEGATFHLDLPATDEGTTA